MDAATLQNRIYQGYAKAAIRIGTLYNQYRPSTAADPLATQRGTIYTSFNAEDFGYSKPNKYGKPTWYALLDGTLTRPGDYLVGSQGTFFIAAQQLNLPILVVECNRSVRIARNAAPTTVGAVAYGGSNDSTAADNLGTSSAGNLLTGWPASVLIGGRSDKMVTEPMSVKSAGYQVLLPCSVPITISQGDVLHDDLNRRYSVYAAELTDLGWRLNVNEEHT